MMKMIHGILVCIAIGLFIACAGCTSNQPPGPPVTTPQPTATVTQTAGGGSAITIQNFAFIPASVTIARGTMVTWTNQDSVDHQIINDAVGQNAQGALFESNPLPKGATYSFTFTSPGTYPYHCNIHPSMKATIIVT